MYHGWGSVRERLLVNLNCAVFHLYVPSCGLVRVCYTVLMRIIGCCLFHWACGRYSRRSCIAFRGRSIACFANVCFDVTNKAARRSNTATCLSSSWQRDALGSCKSRWENKRKAACAPVHYTNIKVPWSRLTTLTWSCRGIRIAVVRLLVVYSSISSIPSLLAIVTIHSCDEWSIRGMPLLQGVRNRSTMISLLASLMFYSGMKIVI